MSDLSLAPFLDSVTIVKVYDHSCLPSFVISKSCVVIVSAVTLSADASKYNSTSFENAVYPRMQSSMGTSRLFLSFMNNSHALEILYLGNGDINLPDDPNKSESGILIGSIVGSVVVGLAFLLIVLWIIYKRSQPKVVKQEIDPDEFQLVEDPDTPFMNSSSAPTSPNRSDSFPLPPQLLPSYSLTQLNKNSSEVSENSIPPSPIAQPKIQLMEETHVAQPQDDDDLEEDEQEFIRVRPVRADSVISEGVVSSITAESDFLARIKGLSSKDDSFSVHESDASSIDDEMIQTLENLIRVDDWQGITSDFEKDQLSLSDRDGNMSQLESTLSMEEVQSIIKTGEWEKLSVKSTKSRETNTGLSSSGLSER